MVATATSQDFFQVQLYPPEQKSLAQTRLLIPLENLLEVLTLTRQSLCPVPGVPQGVLGVTNQRGQLIWVVDWRSGQNEAMPSLRPNPQEKLTVVLLGQGEGDRLGLVVTELRGIAGFDLSTATTVTSAWRRFYPHCDRQLAQDSVMAFTLDITRLLAYLQGPSSLPL
ncbi:CheW domain-containing protein [Synechococcus moorigangaii CMS01]|nr:CheW domain-containing protein [Synechococcus moorigangaii CMS01]